MAKYHKNTKGLLKLLIKVMCLFLSIFTVVACSNINGKTNKDTNENSGQDKGANNTKTTTDTNLANDTKITKIAFEKNSNIYIYNEINGKIISPGDVLKSKDLLALSPDKMNIVFRSFDEEKATYPPHIVVYDIETQELTDVVINDKNVQQVMELKWLDNENILVTGHINPSTSGYGVYNIKSKDEIMSCLGTIWDVNINNKKIIYSNTPHIFPAPKANLIINGNMIFQADDINEKIFDVLISKDDKMIAFRSWIGDDQDLNSETIAYLNVAKINSDGKSISEFKKISISSDTSGKLKFDDENNLSIVGDDFIYKLKDNILIKEKSNFKAKEELSVEQLNKFKQSLAKQFPDEVISIQTMLEDIDIRNMLTF
ncbi:MAG: hypothetical protein ACREVX_02950 [Clostridium sp.]|uniref:hypothetical protein n=1 Tax=Clostridium sp. TaxID=1506 RepID=UPI003D6CBB84